MNMKQEALWEMSYRYKQAAKAETDLKEAEKCLKTLRGATPFLKILGVFT